MARKHKYDYDSDDFFDQVLLVAKQGYTDKEIADALGLSPDTFGKMKNGNYRGWTNEENERRSERLCRVLAHGRIKILAVIRTAYLKAALGGKMLHRKATVYRSIRFADATCTPEEVVQVTESENEQPPSVRALSTWLKKYDPEWRNKEDTDKPTEVDIFLANNSNNM